MTCRINRKKGGERIRERGLKRGRVISNKTVSSFGGSGGLAATFLTEIPFFPKTQIFFRKKFPVFYQP